MENFKIGEEVFFHNKHGLIKATITSKTYQQNPTYELQLNTGENRSNVREEHISYD